MALSNIIDLLFVIEFILQKKYIGKIINNVILQQDTFKKRSVGYCEVV